MHDIQNTAVLLQYGTKERNKLLLFKLHFKGLHKKAQIITFYLNFFINGYIKENMIVLFKFRYAALLKALTNSYSLHTYRYKDSYHERIQTILQVFPEVTCAV
jgi:hypothetical protein